MPGPVASNAADVLTKTAGADPLTGIAQLISQLAPIFLGQSGSGTQNTSGQTASQQQGTSSGTTTGTQTGTSNQTTTGTSSQTTTSTSDPSIIQALLGLFNTANKDANDPTGAQAVIDQIIHESLLAFGPVLANANAAGLYNSSTLGLLGGEAAGQATKQGAAAALQFKQNAQNTAANVGASLLNAIKTSTTSGTTGQTTAGTTAQTTNQTTNNITNQTTTGQTAGQTQTTNKTNPQISGLGGGLGSASSLIPLLSILGPIALKGITGKSPTDLVGSGFDYLKKLLFGGDDLQDIGFGPGNLFPAEGPPALSSDFGITSPVTNQFAQVAADPAARGLLLGQNGLPLGTGASTVVGGSAANPLIGGLEGDTPSPLTVVNQLAEQGAAAEAAAAGGGGIVLSGLDPSTFPLPPIPPGAGAGVDELGLNFTSSQPVAGLLSSLGGAPNITTGIPGGFGDVDVADLASGAGFDSGLDVGTTVGNAAVETAPDIGGSSLFTGLAGDLANPIAGVLGGFAGKFLAPEGKPGGQTIGSAVGGGLAGLSAILGAPLGPLGVFGGALIGSLIGGAFGPNKANTYSFAGLQLNPDGTLALGNQVEQAYSGQSIRDPIQGQLNQFNDFLKSTGLRVVNSTSQAPAGMFRDLNGSGNFVEGPTSGPISLGIDQTQSSNGSGQAGNLGRDLIDVFHQLRFEAADPALNALIAGKGFGSPDLLIGALQGIAPPPDPVYAPLTVWNPAGEAVAVGGPPGALPFASSPADYSPAQQQVAIAESMQAGTFGAMPEGGWYTAQDVLAGRPPPGQDQTAWLNQYATDPNAFMGGGGAGGG